MNPYIFAAQRRLPQIRRTMNYVRYLFEILKVYTINWVEKI